MILELKNLQFSYSSNKPIIQIDHFQIQEKEKVFLFGPSGTGKSTLLGLITGILTPQEGEVLFQGGPFHTFSSQKRDSIRGEKMGYIFQSFNLIPFLNVRENVLLPFRVNKKILERSKENPEMQLEKYADELGLKEFLDSKASELSVGQQQRVAALRALMGSPDLIIADEPTSSLDEGTTEDYMELLSRVQEEIGFSLLFVSHDQRLKSFFDRSVDLCEINKA